MRLQAKLFIPKDWKQLQRPLQKKFELVENLLRATLSTVQPTYGQLDQFKFNNSSQTKIRKTVAKAISKRARHSFTMAHEIAYFNKAMQEVIFPIDETVYGAATKVRRLIFGSAEPLRRFDMTISYHSWMRIVPPVASDPIFNRLSELMVGQALFGALNTYLILLTSHPYSDGNGRTSRLMFNMLLARSHGSSKHYIPIGELTFQTNGVYEEYIANACRSGDFRQLTWLLLSLLEEYAIFLDTLKLAKVENALQKALSWAGGSSSKYHNRWDLNDMPPYLIPFSEVIEFGEKEKINTDFVNAVLDIARMLCEYGSIEFILTGLADLVKGASPATGSIAIFIKATRREDLTLHFRELRSKYLKTVRIQIAIVTGESAVDAKLLVNLVSQYTSRDLNSRSCPVLLHDFEPMNTSIAEQTPETEESVTY